ncbi:homeobox protein knotted-1-like 7 isoform X2 [Apium graveolens]|uniref:homeobox protein knotted-1-like 7 isoform X2 n=1 Tax=Apium graveolens TaxID=4045 RepID=UPI003D7926E5
MEEEFMGMMGSTSGGIGSIGDKFSGEQQLREEIANHPLYEQVLAAHVSCLRVATPIDQLPNIDAQLNQSRHILQSSLLQHITNNHPNEIDNFLAQYLLALCSFKEQLQQHVRVHAVEAVNACRQIEHDLQSLTGTLESVYANACSISQDNT